MTCTRRDSARQPAAGDGSGKDAELETAAKDDRLAWIAYPKSGQLGTDLDRDVLWKHLLKRSIQGVRQVAIDDVWSGALPAEVIIMTRSLEQRLSSAGPFSFLQSTP